MHSMLEAMGQRAAIEASSDQVKALHTRFVKAFANPPQEPEEDFAPSLQAALFLLNDSTVSQWLTPKDNNLAARLAGMSDAAALADELYLSVLSRQPSEEEKSEVADYLAENADRRPAAIGNLIWALLASTEFCVNH